MKNENGLKNMNKGKNEEWERLSEHERREAYLNKRFKGRERERKRER